MPTKNPRLTITMEPPLAAQLRRISELTGNSQSKLIAEILEGSGPVFDRVIRVLEAAKTATAVMKGKASTDLDEAQKRVEAQLGLVMEEFDEATGSLLTGVETVKRRARKAERRSGDERGTRPVPTTSAAPAPALATPISNRGVRSTANPRKSKKAQA